MSAAVMPKSTPVANANSTARRVPSERAPATRATPSTGAAMAAHASQAPVEAKSRPPSVPGEEQERGEADGEHARPGEVGPAEATARPPGPRRECEEDAAGEHRLHDQELADPEGEGLEAVADGVGAQSGEPDRAAGQAQHQADAAADRPALVGTGVGLRFALLEHRRGGVGERRPQGQQDGRHAPRTVVCAVVRRSILIVSASMGAGHDGAAKELRRRLEASGHRVEVVDFLDAVAFHIGPLLRWFYQVQLRMAPWSYELSYKLAPVLRAPAVMLDTWLTRRKLKRAITGVPPRRGGVGLPPRVARARPDAAQEAAPRAGAHVPHRLRGALALGAPGHRPPPRGQRDLGRGRHLTRRTRTPGRAGRSSATGSATPTYDRDAVRTNLGLAPEDRAVLVVAGSWGVGDVVATVEAIGRSGEFHPITVCGRDDNLRAELEQGGYGTVIGWTDQMPALMTAADALVENAGGLTCMEAFAVGLPVITFKPIAGHGKDNAEMMARAGVNCYARDDDELHTMLARR